MAGITRGKGEYVTEWNFVVHPPYQKLRRRRKKHTELLETCQQLNRYLKATKEELFLLSYMYAPYSQS